MRVELGNTAVKEMYRDENDAVRYRNHDGLRVTYVSIPDEYTLAEAFKCVTDPQGVWANHSDAAPAWVSCTSPGLEMLLAEHFKCPVGAPDDVEDTHFTHSGPPGVHPGAASIDEETAE